MHRTYGRPPLTQHRSTANECLTPALNLTLELQTCLTNRQGFLAFRQTVLFLHTDFFLFRRTLFLSCTHLFTSACDPLLVPILLFFALTPVAASQPPLILVHTTVFHHPVLDTDLIDSHWDTYLFTPVSLSNSLGAICVRDYFLLVCCLLWYTRVFGLSCILSRVLCLGLLLRFFQSK
ncbi:uncharacterized protein EV422DRAFT_46008 [Fimicolochytrium jonesii]|uniref:uncharacterized protein n=1 Tax=Fimicolochytrium jonesii TaxID=1396493 RepID=UPI0022FEDA50|nr:uncharacterized protein EV422DRAFT_46008 [Fimicolochytrium jonesii]KAI8821530.1 hypothetical protein EV422DRAFT_46008 [Fimicolochytrium jonesii]